MFHLFLSLYKKESVQRRPGNRNCQVPAHMAACSEHKLAVNLYHAQAHVAQGSCWSNGEAECLAYVVLKSDDIWTRGNGT